MASIDFGSTGPRVPPKFFVRSRTVRAATDVNEFRTIDGSARGMTPAHQAAVIELELAYYGGNLQQDMVGLNEAIQGGGFTPRTNPRAEERCYELQSLNLEQLETIADLEKKLHAAEAEIINLKASVHAAEEGLKYWKDQKLKRSLPDLPVRRPDQGGIPDGK